MGIETSCDETCAAVVVDGRIVKSNVISSQVALHSPFGGVVPEIASRQHIRAIVPVVKQALLDADVQLDQIGNVCATVGPGLAGSLLVGMNFARCLALGLGVPFLPVNHLEGHLFSVWLSLDDPPPPPPELPLLALIVSGGHTELVWMREPAKYTVVGRTRDDAAGEAFDKVGRLLGLPYPGGPPIQRAATMASDPVRLPRARLPGTFDFSFSGLKTAVMQTAYLMAEGKKPSEIRGQAFPDTDITDRLSDQQVADIAAGFQESVVDILSRKTVDAANQLGAASIAVVGGVASNAALRERVVALAAQPVFVPAPEFSTDNGAMIAAAGFFAPSRVLDVDVEPALTLAG